MQLNRRMRDSRGNQMRRKLFFFGFGAEAYYALDVERREVLELDATFIDDEPWPYGVAWTSSSLISFRITGCWRRHVTWVVLAEGYLAP